MIELIEYKLQKPLNRGDWQIVHIIFKKKIPNWTELICNLVDRAYRFCDLTTRFGVYRSGKKPIEYTHLNKFEDNETDPPNESINNGCQIGME